jgi:hypothetical protein
MLFILIWVLYVHFIHCLPYKPRMYLDIDNQLLSFGLNRNLFRSPLKIIALDFVSVLVGRYLVLLFGYLVG